MINDSIPYTHINTRFDVCVCAKYMFRFSLLKTRESSLGIERWKNLPFQTRRPPERVTQKKIKLQLRQHIYIHYAARKAQFCLRFRKKLKPIHCRDLGERKKKSIIFLLSQLVFGAILLLVLLLLPHFRVRKFETCSTSGVKVCRRGSTDKL